jgi:hypothetical protein
MTTTFKTMPPSALSRPRRRPSIIAALAVTLVLALSGCSLLQIGYSQASPFAFRWLDRYVDFDDAQSLVARTALDDTVAWHRRTQLPDYMQLLARAESEVLGDATPEHVRGAGNRAAGPILQVRRRHRRRADARGAFAHTSASER